MDWLISTAHAQSAGASGDPGMFNFIFILVLFGALYFFIMRPQMKRQKEHRAMVDALSKGDEVITNGGVFGKVTEVGESVATVEIAGNVQIRVQKFAVAKVLPKGTIKALK